MAIFEYGEYKIDIDEEKTKKYFEETEISECQGNRNFQKYVSEMISDDEKSLFESLHIDLSKVDFCYGTLSKNKKYSCNLEAYIIGEFLSYPETADVTLDEVREDGVEILENNKSNIITVGNLYIQIYTPDDWVPGPEMPENSICIEIDVKDIPWLLNEKCEDKEESKILTALEYYSLYAIHYIPNLICKIKDRKNERKKLIHELEVLKEKCCFSYEILSNKEAKGYKKLWVNSILPKNADGETRKQALKLCVNSRKDIPFLWEIFSFDIIKTKDNPTEEFNKTEKKDCTLVLASCNHTCVNLKNAEKLTEQDIINLCNNVSGWCDFVITADDFSWAYSRTHEDGWCGPYFY